MTRLVRGLLLVAVMAFTACGSSSGTTGPSIGYVGNSTCPTTGSAGPYFPDSSGNATAAPTNGPAVGQAIDEMPHTHVTPPSTVTYEHDPPTSGCHYNLGTGTAPITEGAYDQVIQPEYWVHNLEHGYIAVLYNCPKQSCQSDFTTLVNWYKSLSPGSDVPSACGSYAKVIIVPETTMKPKFAMVSWDWYDPMQTTLDMNTVNAFYNNHKDQDPESGVC